MRLRRMRGLAAEESGSILPLVAGFVAVALALILVTTSATSLYLARTRLHSLADAAALAGAESFWLGQLAESAPGSGGSPHPRLDATAVAAAAARQLAADAPLEAGRLDGVELVRAGSADGRSATVRLVARWRPGLLTVFVPRGVRIEVEASARSVFR